MASATRSRPGTVQAKAVTARCASAARPRPRHEGAIEYPADPRPCASSRSHRPQWPTGVTVPESTTVKAKPAASACLCYCRCTQGRDSSAVACRGREPGGRAYESVDSSLASSMADASTARSVTRPCAGGTGGQGGSGDAATRPSCRSGRAAPSLPRLPTMAEVRIGVSGWRYAPWRGDLDPPGLAQRPELEHIAATFPTVVLDGPLCSLQRPASYARWREETPPGFTFAVKGGRFITHFKQLRDARVPLANFLASGVLALEDRLGPVLWQLPARRSLDLDRIAEFLDLLPSTTARAAELATEHDERLDGRAWTTTDADRPLRHALEVRHASFADPDFLRLLREHGVSLVVSDGGASWPVFEETTAGLVSVRLHGAAELSVRR